MEVDFQHVIIFQHYSGNPTGEHYTKPQAADEEHSVSSSPTHLISTN